MEEDFLYPLFLVCRIEASASTTFPEFQGQFQTVAPIKEGRGCRNKEEHQETIDAATGQSLGSASRDIYDKSLSSLQN